MCFFSFAMWAEEKKEDLVYLEHSETLSFDEKRHPDAQLLKGDVRFRHEDALMYCDSAYFYEKTNSLDAFGHVRFVQGDTLFGYGDVLYYNGNTKFARLRRHVKLVHKATILTTDSLNYDRKRDIAWYYTGGVIQDTLNTLTSRWGQYTPNNDQAIFKYKVTLDNPNFTLTSDTLYYNTATNIADLVCPTEIVYDEETTILSSKGWYNTRTERSMLYNHSQIIHNDGKSLTGDTIYYDKRQGFGQVWHDMEMRDTVQQATLKGNYGEMDETEEVGFATDSALFIDWSSEDWLYMHADTLYTEKIPYRYYTLIEKDSILVDSVMTAQLPDTAWHDSTYQQIRAFYKVRVYRIDVQAVCDSLLYNSRDSILTLFTDPVAWSDANQVSADILHIYMKDGTVDYAHGIGSAIAIKQESATQFDQLSGKELYAFVREGELRQIDVNGNAETVFFPREDDNGPIIGCNKTQSSYVKLYLQEQKIHHIVFTTTTTGTMYPLKDISESDTYLNNFFWAERERPRLPGDVFLRPTPTPRPKGQALSAIEKPESESGEEASIGNKRKDRKQNKK